MNYSYLAVARLKPGVSPAQAQCRDDGRSRRRSSASIRKKTRASAPRSCRCRTTRSRPCVRRSTSCSRRSRRCSSSAAPTWRTCWWRGRWCGSASWPSARRSAPARARLIMQSIGELVPMLVAGGALGLLGAAWVVGALVPLLPAGVPRVENVGLHLPVLAGTAATLAAIAVFVGVWPALEASRGGLNASVADLSRGNTGRARHDRACAIVLVVAQIAATLWLVIGAALLTRSFGELRQVRPGIQSGAGVQPAPRDSAQQVPDGSRRRGVRRPHPRARPGAAGSRVRRAGQSAAAGGRHANRSASSSRGSTRKPLALGNVDYRSVTPDYFRTLEIPLLSGRSFAETDTETAPPVAIIDERLAKTRRTVADPVGRRVRIPIMNLPWLTDRRRGRPHPPRSP